MIRSILFIASLSFALFTVLACSGEGYPTVDRDISMNTKLEHPPIKLRVLPTIDSDTTVFYTFENRPIEVIIKFPTETAFKGTIIALPGWNFDNSQWCDSTDLCKKALAQGYALILPEMGKSIYCDSVFPETRKDWLKYPTRSWIKTTMIPKIQTELQLLAAEQNNFVMGLSTGARGAVLLALDLPELFSACGALSGDYDQSKYTKDNLYNGYYGPFAKFPDRWIGKDNAITSIKKLTVPVYIAHGEQDKIVPIPYSQQLFVELQESGNEKSILNVNPTAGHTYSFWNSEVDAVLSFFGENSEE